MITCATLNNPASGFVVVNGIVNLNGDWKFGAEAIYSCNTGFSSVGDRNRTCTGDGSSTTGAFSGIAPSCDRKK